MFIFNITMINVVLILVGPVNAWTFHFMDFLGHSHSSELSFRTCHLCVLWMCGSKNLMPLAKQWYIFSSLHFLRGVANHKNHLILVIMLSTIIIVCSATSLALNYCPFFRFLIRLICMHVLIHLTGIFQCCYLSLCQ